MSSEDLAKVEALMRSLEERLEKRMTRSDSHPPARSELRGWKAAGLVLSVLTAVTAPVLGVTWYASTRMNQLDEVQKDLNRTQANMAAFRAEVSTDINDLRKEIQRLREAFAAYTQTVLPMLARDTPQVLRFTPPAPHGTTSPVLPAEPEGGGS